MTQTANGQCVYPTTQATNVTFGTKVRFLNNTTDLTTIFHVNGVNAAGQNDGETLGIPHENQNGPGEAVGSAYEGTLTKVNGTTAVGLSWYCHTPGPSRNLLLIRAVDPTN